MDQVGKKSDQIRARLRRVEAFHDGLVELLGECEPVDRHLGQLVWQPKAGRDEAANRLAVELERRTQPAAEVVQECGATVELRAAGTWQTREANPVLLWRTLFDRPVLPADLIIGQCNRAIGMLRAQIEDAEAHEATAAGRIESRLDGPRGIWRALRGARHDVREHQSVAWRGFAGGIVAAVIAAGIVYRLGWNQRLVNRRGDAGDGICGSSRSYRSTDSRTVRRVRPDTLDTATHLSPARSRWTVRWTEGSTHIPPS